MEFDGNALYPMTASLTAGRQWRSKLFTASTTFVVPPDVYAIWVDGSGAGGGGGGGDPTPGGGGSGGGMGGAVRQFPLAVTPGETLTIVIGAPGVGGAAGAAGTHAGSTYISGPTAKVVLQAGQGGNPGTPGAGGDVIGVMFASDAVITNFGLASTVSPPSYFAYEQLNALALFYNAPTAGGALNANGGGRTVKGIEVLSGTGGFYTPGATGTALGGGGGHGATNNYMQSTVGGIGGSDGAAGTDGLGYGSGGGGGSGNAAGGNGAPGFFRLYMFTAYEI